MAQMKIGDTMVDVGYDVDRNDDLTIHYVEIGGVDVIWLFEKYGIMDDVEHWCYKQGWREG